MARHRVFPHIPQIFYVVIIEPKEGDKRVDVRPGGTSLVAGKAVAKKVKARLRLKGDDRRVLVSAYNHRSTRVYGKSSWEVK